MAIEAGGAGRGESELVTGDVIGMRVRDEAARLAAADVDGQLSGGDEEAGVVVEHAERVEG